MLQILRSSLSPSPPILPAPPAAEATAHRQPSSNFTGLPERSSSSRPTTPSPYNTPTRSPSTEPVAFQSSGLVSREPDRAPTPPTTAAPAIPSSVGSQEGVLQQGVSLSAADPILVSRRSPSPLRQAIQLTADQTLGSSQPDDMPFKLPQQQKREGPTPKHKPASVSAPRHHGLETPAPSNISRQMNHEGLARPPPHIGANGVPTITFPPSPPTTRPPTTVQSVRSSAPKYKPSLQPAQPPKSLISTHETLVIRPSTSSSSGVSLHEVKLGKALGRQPIDYLIPNGSLSAPVSENFHPYQEPNSLAPSPGTDRPVAEVFANLNNLLDAYLRILSNGGSMAVGTGYQSVARKLLQQVGGMFARDVGVDGVDWSDILGYIRSESHKPCLCVLPVKGLLQNNIDAATILSGTGPNQELALQPTKELAESVVAGVKEKTATGKVEEWLEEVEKVLRRQQPPPSPTLPTISEEVEFEYEDEVVTQIIEGILPNPAQIDVFRSYLADHPYLTATKLALIRMYPQHAPASITKPIVALYLLLHPELHPLLKAIGGLSDAEMELINSGRFDGFLDGSSNAVPRDEEEELSCITILDKKLWHVVEVIEDEMEELHNRALIVRRALMERKDNIAKRVKRRIQENEYGDTTVVNGGDDLGDDEEQDNLSPLPVEEWDGGKSILLSPEDSASNVNFSRKRQEARREKDEREESEKRRAEKRERKELKRREDGRISKFEFDDDAAAGTNVSRRRKEKKSEKKDPKACEGKGCCADCVSTTKRGRSGKRGDSEEPEVEREKKEHKDRKDEHRERKEERENRRMERESRREEREREARERETRERDVREKEVREKEKKVDKGWSRALSLF